METITALELATYSTIGATIVALLAFFTSIWSAMTQRKHNRLSVRPLPEVQLRDMDGHIRIQLRNNGTGPLIIDTFRVGSGENKGGKTLIELMPQNESNWTFFVHNIDGRSIRPNGEIILLELEYDHNNGAELAFANSTRAILCKLEIVVNYKSVYNDKLPQYDKSLSWFGRLIS
ncbi:hypothetical protein [Pseudomonas yamanorum]|uniref:hypothetical protein n=1 Tax=Pseudomonas yamanorum TaxID=515393 RepID=UPI003B9F2D5B